MRLDKFLKVSRIIKRRSVANEACAGSRVRVNDKVAKPAQTIKVGDMIEIAFGEKTAKYEVLSLSEHVAKGDASLMYRVVE